MVKLDFTEAIRKGLRPDSRLPIGSQYLTTCTNLRPTQYGLKDFRTINQPITASELSSLSITKSWPQPQLFCGKKETILFKGNGVYRVDTTTPNDWQLTAVTTKDMADLGSASPANKAITTGGTWHFVDFFDTLLAFNGVSVVLSCGVDSNIYTTDSVTISTGGNFKDARAFMAGFDPSDMFALADWPTYLDGFFDNVNDEVAAKTLSAGADSNWVWWSTIGGGDLFWLFSLDFMKYGSFSADPDMGYSDEYPYIKELWKRNEFGLRPMPWTGTIYRTMQLGEAMMIYGDGGASMLVPYADPVSTFGLRDIQGFPRTLGMSARSAVSGSEEAHLLVDETGELWLIDTSYKAERIGHKEWLDDMLINDIVVSYSPQYREFTIADGTLAYTLTENGGFCKSPQMPTSVHFMQGDVQGIVTNVASPSTVVLESEPFMLGEPGQVTTLKQLKLVGTDIDATGWSAIIKYRFKNSQTWTSTSSVSLNEAGIALFNVSAIEYKWYLTHPDRTKCDVDNIEVIGSNDGKVSMRRWLDASTPGAATV